MIRHATEPPLYKEAAFFSMDIHKKIRVRRYPLFDWRGVLQRSGDLSGVQCGTLAQVVAADGAGQLMGSGGITRPDWCHRLLLSTDWEPP